MFTSNVEVAAALAGLAVWGHNVLVLIHSMSATLS